MSLTDLQTRLRRARGDRFRRGVVDDAMAIPGAPDTLSETRLRALETHLQTPPNDGSELRAYLAALGVNVFDALRDMGYWPPLPSPTGKPVAELLLEELGRLDGYRVTRAGTKFVVERL